MTLEEVKESYNTLIAKEEIKLSKLKKDIFRIGSVRLAIVIGCIAACYFLWSDIVAVTVTILLSVIIFLFFLKYHNRLFIRKRYCELLIADAQNELKALNYDFSVFDGAAEKADANHSYSLDLDLFGERSFFQSINRTVTTFGKDSLADSLLDGYQHKNEILAQQQAIKELTPKVKLARHFRATGQMSHAGDLNINDFSEQFLQTKLMDRNILNYFTFIAPVAFFASAVLAILNVIPVSVIGLCWTILFMLSLIPLKNINKKKEPLDKKVSILQTYSDLFEIIEKENFESASLNGLKGQLNGKVLASKVIYQLKRYCDNLDQSSNVLGLLILNPIFFWHIRYTLKIERWINTHKEDVGRWFGVLAKFDSLVSLAIFAYNHPGYSYPEVSDKLLLEGKDMGHPMINRDACVCNDVQIPHQPYFLVVTGANMAGKSTYLRTVGVNLVLACAGAPVCASSLKFYPYRLVTNLRTSDSLNDNESYFFAELKRLKMIIDRLKSGEQLFIILDEILKGTNSEDKQKGSISLMKQLVSLSGNGIIATHDLVLGNLEKEFPSEIKNYRFEADINGEHLSFTYKMKEGIAQNMNASFLMKKMGITLE
ncbi:hypothetical protein [Dysgonomonas sp. 511]|uniref:MutS-related protein n=1 Tax=Dysgonomonas sp. 511 TaxID=2302930 RepID=UPI0013D88253|nr:hypothetical protein [Dysgonomonas sp. 511]NDV77454.1 hypothetical protein [Dysgonomonas sp. 511]